ncbi:MAG TPA: S9 family peptidase, partial [Thermoanaerobaculia bacterium]|nr:S9 family peptidase [Thermoanaerobaculia bacterium]
MRLQKRALGPVLALSLALLATAPVLAAGQELDYPETRRVDHVDTYHGVEVADPYRWLEEDVRESEEVRRWVEAQNEVTFAFLESIPERAAIRERLTELVDYERVTPPQKEGGRYFFLRNE